MRYYSIGEFSKAINVAEQTLRNWDKKGILTPHHKTVCGKRFYSQEQLNNYICKYDNSNRKIVGYCRVSSIKQKDELERQIENVKTYMYARGYQFKIISDIGSGIDYNKEGLLTLLELIQSNKVEKVVILYKDRLLEFGYELFENVCKYYNTKIEIIDNTEKSDEEELMENMIQIVTLFSSRLQGKRAKQTRRIINELKSNDIINKS